MQKHFTENIKMANKHIKRCPTVAIRETLIKAMSYYDILIRMTKIKNSGNTKCSWWCRETDYSYMTDGNVKWYNHTGKEYGSFLQN